MINKEYPSHDINLVFDMLEETIKGGGCADNTGDELLFLNRLFAALPPEAVEYGMRFLHGERDLPKSCDEIMPLYIRFMNLVEYLEKVESLREIPSSMSTEAIMERQKTMASLDKNEEAFLKPLLGFKFNSESSAPVPAPAEEEKQDEGDSGKLHLMNCSAAVFMCKDIVKTALFYEAKCGFKAAHLEDESMPHIRLVRDNIAIVLVNGDDNGIRPPYSLYIYVSEPFLLQNELKTAGVNIVRELPEAQQAEKSIHNREFVFEDNDGRLICVSQNNVID